MKLLRTTLFCVLGLACVASPAHAFPEYVIPFDGYVELDGVPLEGRYGVRISFYNIRDRESPNFTREWSAEDGRSCGDIDSCEVPFYRGRFSILLGRYGNLSGVITSRDDLTISIEIRAQDGTWVPLAGRRTITAVPYALYSQRTTDLRAGGSVTIEGSSPDLAGIDLGDATIDGAMTVGDLSVTGTTTADSLDIAGGLSVADGEPVSALGDLIVGGGLTVADRVELDGAVLVEETDGSLAFAPDDSITAMVVEATNFVDQVTINGDLTLTNDTGVWGNTDEELLRGDVPLMQVVQVRMGTSETANTGVDADEWFCWIGGYRFVNGNWDVTGDDDNVLDIYTYRSSGTWRVRAHVNNDGNPRREVTMICAQDSMVTENDEWYTE